MLVVCVLLVATGYVCGKWDERLRWVHWYADQQKERSRNR